MVSIKTEEEIKLMRKSGRLLAEMMMKLVRVVKPGLFTIELENLANQFIISCGAESAFKGFPSNKRGVSSFPSTLCVSINEEIVHGIPQKRQLKEGDIVSIDAGLKFKGYFSDMAITVPVGKIKKKAQHLLKVTKNALYQGISRVKEGARLSDISAAIEEYVYRHNCYVIKELAGHGIGRSLHEEPNILNYGFPGKGIRLKKGMCLAIEPLVSLSTEKMKTKKDGWTIVTADSSLSAHFEHTVLVTPQGAEILTSMQE